MSNFSKIPISHYKVLTLPLNPESNSVYYVLDQYNNIVQGFITDKKGVAIPLFSTGGEAVGNVQSVTGTGVTGTLTNPKVNIATFVSNQLGNQVHLSTIDGKLQVNPITSPDASIEITSTSTELQIKLSSAIASEINSALQPGDNTSVLVNDGDGTSPYVTFIDLADVATTGDYNDLINTPSSFPPSAHTHPISDIVDLQVELNSKVDENTPITGATHTKITYDSKGLVISGVNATTSDIDDSVNRRYVTDSDLVDIGNLSGVNSGDQTSITGILSTKTEYNTSLIDGDFLYVGDVTQYTDEQAQDAVGNILTDTATIDLSYNDSGNNITANVKPNSITSVELSDSINISEFMNDSN